MRRLQQEGGFTLPEMLVGAMLMVIIMSASLSVLDQFRLISVRTDQRVDMQDRARQTSRSLARSLRNAAPSPELTSIIERAEEYDLVFRAVDRPQSGGMGGNALNLRRVRYCLDDNNRDNARLLEQTQRWTTTATPAIPNASACPGPGWTETRFVTDRITNRSDGANRPLWTYGRTAAGQITSLKLNLFMNADPSTPGSEVPLQTGIYLRNQNRSPGALFSAVPTGLRHVLLNGSTSSDPEGDPLEYHWFVNGVEVGRGLIFDYAAATGGRYDFSLEVRDPSGLFDRSDVQTVVLP